MIRRQAILLDPNPSPGTGGDFLQTLPEELRGESSLQSFKDVGSLAKSHVEAQKMIGTKRLAAPSDDWGDDQWNEFYTATGRPETPNDYKLPEVKWEEGLGWDEGKVKDTFAKLHAMGLSQKQAEGVMTEYAAELNGAHKSHVEGLTTSKAQVEGALRTEWGDKFDHNLELSKGALRQFGSEEFVSFLEQSGLDNHPEMVKTLHRIATGMMEDHARGKGGDMLKLSNAANAKEEVQRLRMDNGFMKAFTTAQHPEHQAAVDRMSGLMRVAHPGEEKD